MRDLLFPETMAIRVPRFLKEMISAEAIKRNFIKKNGKSNENDFLNKMLPNMLSFRSYKKEILREYIEKNVKPSIAAGMQEKMIDFLSETFDYLYFDENEYERDAVINLRFDTAAESLYAELFARLDEVGIKRSAYLRNLIHEYMNKSEYKKERICFKEEYNALSSVISSEIICQMSVNRNSVRANCVSLQFSISKEHWYLFYFEEGKYDKLYSAPLYSVNKIVPLHYKNNLCDTGLYKMVREIIYGSEHEHKDEFLLH